VTTNGVGTDVSVVIVNWNTRDLLARCLQSVGQSGRVDPAHPATPPRARSAVAENAGRSTGNAGWSTEVFVVDNGSADGSAQMVRERFPWVHLIQNDQNIGFAAANNQALREARSRYLLLLNSDTEVRRGALRTLVDFMDAHPRAGAAGARLVSVGGSLQSSCHPMLTPGREFWRLLFLDRIWPRATYPMERWDLNTPRLVEVIKGACLLLRRDALDQVGLLDEAYFVYTEEVDLCFRLARAAWQLWWVPGAEVVHREAQSTRLAAEPMYLQLYRSKVQFYRKFGGPRRAEKFKWVLRLAYWPRLAVAAIATPSSSAMGVRARTYRRLLAELSGM
jgi:N-acetylglucosaminyl-diphospho-decaprenol L-rhamnosyltransferase